MVIKKVKSGTYIFQKDSGITAFFSEEEEELLYLYFKNGERNEFINRLYDLGVIKNCENIRKNKEDILLQSIHIDITDSCPLRCTQCYKGESINKFMKFDLLKSIIDEAEKLNCFQIAIGGGEPVTHKDIIKIVKYISKTKMSVSITSSGYGLDINKIEELKKAGLNHIQISLNGSTNEVNNLSRDGFEYAINALNILSKYNISFGINTVVRSDNIDDLQNIINMGKKLGVENINLLRYKPNDVEDYNLYELNEIDIKKLLLLIKKNMDINIKVDSAFTPLLMLSKNGEVSKNQSGCGALSNFINITVEGKFKPCSHINLEEKANCIFDYYTSSKNKELLYNIKYTEKANCTKCKFNEYCFGCLAITQYKCEEIVKGEIDCKYYREE